MSDSVMKTSTIPLGLSPTSTVDQEVHTHPIRRWFTFLMQPQTQTEWCWAAVAVSVSLYYNSGSEWDQCSLVNDQLGQSTCCINGATAACNQPWFLDRSLLRTGNLVRITAGAAPFAEVQSEVDSHRPLGVRIGWSGGGGHFVVINGDNGSDLLDIQDPWYGPSVIDYTTFLTAYQGSGSWTNSYWTQS